MLAGRRTGRLVAVAALSLMMMAAFALSASQTASAYVLPPIRHVFVIVLENKSFAQWYTQGGSAAPYLSRTLPAEGAMVPGYYGVGHDSLDNYIAMISGQPPTSDTKNDCPDPLSNVPTTSGADGIAQGNGCVYPSNFPTVADQLTANGFTWGAYEQNIPSPCSLAASGTDGYARKHNPFVFFSSLRDSGQCAQNDLPLDALPTALEHASTTPNYVFITPDQCHDAHTDCTDPSANLVQQQPDELSAADGFLKQWVPAITSSPAFRHDGLLAIVFDEGDDTSVCCGEPLIDPDGSMPGSLDGIPGLGGGQAGAIFLSPFIKPGTVDTQAYNHYSMLHSVENLFGLPPLAEARADRARTFGSDLFTNFTQPSGSGGGSGGSGSGGGSGSSGGSGQGGGVGSAIGAGGGGSFVKAPASCRRTRPVIQQLKVKRVRRHGRSYLRVSGLAGERRCRTRPAASRIRDVLVVVAKPVGRRCRFLTHSGRLTAVTLCRRAVYLLAGRSSRWHSDLRAQLPRGRYYVVAVAVDGAGRFSRYRTRSIRLR